MIKSFTEFINESNDSDLSFEELSQLVEIGLMSSEEAKAELRKQMKARIQPGTSPFDDVNYEALKASPTIQAARLPEAQPFLDAGFKPASTIQQISNGTLYFKKPGEAWTAGIYFMAQSKYVRKDGGDRMQVMAKDLPGEGLEFYKNAMKWVSDKYDLTTRTVTTKKQSAIDSEKLDGLAKLNAEIRPILTLPDVLKDDYLSYLAYKVRGRALDKSIAAIKEHPTSLPIFSSDDFYRADDWISRANHITRGQAVDVKFYNAVPLKIYSFQLTRLNKLRERGLFDADLAKPIQLGN